MTSGKSSNLFKTQLFICLCAWDNNINLKIFCKHVNVLVQVASRSSCQDRIRHARDLLKEGADAGLTQVEERERKEEWVGRCQMAAQFQEMLSQEERLSLSQSHLLEESLALME